MENLLEKLGIEGKNRNVFSRCIQSNFTKISENLYVIVSISKPHPPCSDITGGTKKPLI